MLFFLLTVLNWHLKFALWSCLYFTSFNNFNKWAFCKSWSHNPLSVNIVHLPNFNMLFQLLLTEFSKSKVFSCSQKLITWLTIENGLFCKSKNLSSVFPKRVPNWRCLSPSFAVLNKWTLLSVTSPKYIRWWCEGKILIQAEIQQFIWSANRPEIKFTYLSTGW